jgi:hypothetical protein
MESFIRLLSKCVKYKFVVKIPFLICNRTFFVVKSCIVSHLLKQNDSNIAYIALQKFNKL